MCGNSRRSTLTIRNPCDSPWSTRRRQARCCWGLLKDGRGVRAPGVTLLVDIYATQDHEARLAGARRFSSKDRDQIEEHIANGRLRLRVHDRVISLEERLRGFLDKPVHILAVFDEASTGMRQQPGGINLLPMSPFAMRRRIDFQGIRGQVELLPSMEGSVFRKFYDMQEKLDAQSGQTPQASADAELMREHIESVLTDERPGRVLVLLRRSGASLARRRARGAHLGAARRAASLGLLRRELRTLGAAAKTTAGPVQSPLFAGTAPGASRRGRGAARRWAARSLRGRRAA